MLLSMSISFLLARRFKWKIYVTLVTVIVALVSIFSTCNLFDLRPEYLFLYPPAPPLSFPFHTCLGLIPGAGGAISPPLPPGYVRPPHNMPGPPHNMLGHRLYFLQFQLGELRLEYNTTGGVQRLLSFVFLSLLLINFVGAIFGYWISKTTFIDKLLKKGQNIFL